MRVKSPSLTFMIYGLGQIALNLIAMFIDYYKYYFALQGIAILLTSLFYLYFDESIFYAYKKKSLGKVFRIATYIAKKNHPNLSVFKRKVQEISFYLGLGELLGIAEDNIKSESQTFLESEESMDQKDSENSYINISNQKIDNADLSKLFECKEVLDIKAKNLKSNEKDFTTSKGDMRDIFRSGNFLKLFCCSMMMGCLYAEYGISMMIKDRKSVV